MANGFITLIDEVDKKVEVGAEDALKWLRGAQGKVSQEAPAVLAGLGTLGGSIETALADAAAISANPMQLILNFGTDVKDFAAVWPAIKAFLLTLGVTVK